MTTTIIHKAANSSVDSILDNYDRCKQSFDWSEHQPHGLPNGGLNIAYEALDSP